MPSILYQEREKTYMARILLSGNVNLQYYVDAVTAAGAEAIAKYLPDISTNYDGLILCGGNDIDPKYYHQGLNGSVNIDTQRDTVEFALLKAFVDAGKPILGICRGYQLINVFFGGTLHQDIPEKHLHINHQDLAAAQCIADIVHGITAKENSILHKLYGPTFVVNSSHHQAIDRLGDGLIATAYWNDTYIEAFEHSSRQIYGVQWHPERMCVTPKREGTMDGSKFFDWFLNVCNTNSI